VISAHDCPNCGAGLRHDGVSDFIRCTFCGTEVVLPGARHALTRAELELEREQILAREKEQDERIRQMNARGVEDFLVPPFGCCGIYVALFVVGSLILAAAGLKGSKNHVAAVAGIAIAGALAGLTVIVWRREKRRRDLAAALERERASDLDLRRKRLREIDAALQVLRD
jgi:hypothetical protein